MTLSEISAKFNVSVEELAGVISVPSDYSNERPERLIDTMLPDSTLYDEQE